MRLMADTLFQSQNNLFTGYAQFFHFMLFSLSNIVNCGLPKRKVKHLFRKIEIIQRWYTGSSVAQKLHSVDLEIQAVGR